jgi:hypothetical protein
MHQNPDQSKLSKSESARINGAKSRGATTEAGKLRAANGNLKHGAYSSRVVMQGENPDAYAALLASYIDLFKPTDTFENECVVAMANTCWRTRRLECAETDSLNAAVLLNKPRVEAAFEALDTATERALAIQSDNVNLERNSRVEERLHRIYDRKFKLLSNYRRKSGRPMPESTDPPNSKPSVLAKLARFLVLFALPLTTSPKIYVRKLALIAVRVLSTTSGAPK